MEQIKNLDKKTYKKIYLNYLILSFILYTLLINLIYTHLISKIPINLIITKLVLVVIIIIVIHYKEDVIIKLDSYYNIIKNKKIKNEN